MVYRIYVEKKKDYAIEAAGLQEELSAMLGIKTLQSVRVLQRYDVEGISKDLYEACVHTVFSEPPVDVVYATLPESEHMFAVEYLPGQFDQRADSAAECIQLISQGERPLVKSARVYLLEGDLSITDINAIKKYVINPVEAREASLQEVQTLRANYPVPEKVKVLQGFCTLQPETLPSFVEEYGLAMDAEDLAFCQTYFREEKRDPTMTELRMIDTYWSDHCRHTTFGTQLDNIVITDKKALNTYYTYSELRDILYEKNNSRPQTLMDLATVGAKYLKKAGKLEGLDESDEINACSVNIKVDNNGKLEDWLLLFKNETHNHPTEVEPFGGAATCIGGAIRDPLANRGYVYGAMRVTGAGDPLVPVQETLPGKLPQRKIVTGAAAGYSSYGNQIGLATGQVTELYHPGYVAKRMEIGAVVGAVPLAHVRREEPQPGDVVILLGGRTGRDGIGGATGSSKAHNESSIDTSGAEVQKGNAPVERKLQRLFRNPKATAMIRRCNDFGAGGVSVAIGELADGLRIDLNAVPKKYDGLDGTELAISESQERMAVVVEAKDADDMMALARKENVEATVVAVVTEKPRLVMVWNGEVIVDIAREFLNSNGAEKHADVRVDVMPVPMLRGPEGGSMQQKAEAWLGSLSFCSQKGLAERFDATIGAGTVLMPFGGRHQLSPIQAMVHKLPVEGETTTCSGMAFGFDPYVSEQNPYEGAYLAVLESAAKLVATGFARRNAYLTFQEYFARLGTDPQRWGKPFASLLGALQAQLDLGLASIGGKDSMSGSFEGLDVPPTLVSFAVASGHTHNIIGSEWKLPGSRIVWVRPATGEGLLPDKEEMALVLDTVEKLIVKKRVLSAYAVGRGGVAEALFKMGVGNRLGLHVASDTDIDRWFAPGYGSFVLELAEPENIGEVLGETTTQYVWQTDDETVQLAQVQQRWEDKLEPVFPYKHPSSDATVNTIDYKVEPEQRKAPKIGVVKPKVLVPVFPGTNCEYDTARALRAADAEPDVVVIRNLSPQDVAQSAELIAKKIAESQMIVLPGGFSGGDEPEGSAKLIASFFRGPQVAEQVTKLLERRDGLMLGICNGFQALIKLGLLPQGRITPLDANSPTLTFNTIGRHQSMLVHTRIASNLSPWLMLEEQGAVHTIAISHGEGRFVANENVLQSLMDKGQIATQYVGLDGKPTMDITYNPNGSILAVEGISSPDGRVLGKMGHSERYGEKLYTNVPGNTHQKLFESGVAYFAL